MTETEGQDRDTPPAEPPTLAELLREIRENNRLIGVLTETVHDVSNQHLHVVEAINRQGAKLYKMGRAMAGASHALDIGEEGPLVLPTSHGNGGS